MTTTRLTARLVILAACAATAARGADPVKIDSCIVSLGEDGEAQVAAREAGVIDELIARKGMEVAADADLAILDSDQPRMEREKAQAELDQAKAKAANTVNRRFAEKSMEVAQAAYDKAEDAEKLSQKSVGLQELNRLRLEWQKAELSVEQAEEDIKLAKLDERVKDVAVRAATHAIERRRIKSPIAGIVLDVFKHKGEWMQPGDVLAHVIRADVVQVEFFKKQPREMGIVEGTPVTVLLDRGGGKKVESFKGRITYVRPKVESDENRVCAEVENRKDGDTWLLQLGQEVTMQVHVDPAAAGK